MTIYMKVTLDKYELPMAVADSITELAQILGVTRQTIGTYYARNVRGYIKVEVEYDDVSDRNVGGDSGTHDIGSKRL